MEKDVVCGMTVDPKQVDAKAEFQGRTYYFCCDGCRASFEKEPEKYMAVASSAPSCHCH